MTARVQGIVVGFLLCVAVVVCALLAACSGGDSGGVVLSASPSTVGRVYEFRDPDFDPQDPSSLAVVDFTGVAEVVESELSRGGSYAKVWTGRWCTEVEWDGQPVCLLVDPELNLFVNTLPPSTGAEVSSELHSAFRPLLARELSQIDTQTIGQLWRQSFGEPSIGSCRVSVSEQKRVDPDASSSVPAYHFFYGSYGGSVGDVGAIAPCKYFDSSYASGGRWAVLACAAGTFRLEWQAGVLVMGVSEKGELLARIVDTEGQDLSFEAARSSKLLDGKDPVSPVSQVSGLRVTELAGKPRVFLP